MRPRKVTHDDQLDVVVGSPHYSSHSQCPSENDSPSCPSISASFSLNLNSSVASETRLESTLCAAEASAKFFGFRHISIDRQPCSAVARRTPQAETVIVNLTDE